MSNDLDVARVYVSAIPIEKGCSEVGVQEGTGVLV